MNEELSSLKKAMVDMKGDHETMQRQASEIVRDAKSALQTTNAQQNLLASTIHQEASKLSNVVGGHQELKSSVQDCLNHQGASMDRVETQQKLLHGGVVQIDPQRRLLEQGVDMSTQKQTVVIDQLKGRMDMAYQAFMSLQKEYAEAQQTSDSNRFQTSTEPQRVVIDASSHCSERRQSTKSAPQPTMNAEEMGCAPDTKMKTVPLSPDPRMQAAMVSVYSPVRKPPKFEVDRFASYKELELRKDSHPQIPESALIAEIALQSEIPPRAIMLQFTKETKLHKEERCFSRLMEILNKEFQRDSNERAVMKMQKFQNFRRHVGEDIYLFWIRFDKLIADMQPSQVVYRPGMIF